MSVGKLKNAISELPARRTVNDVATLEKSIGGKLSARESAILGELLDGEWKSFSKPALSALESLVGRAAPNLQPAKFEIAGSKSTGVKEISSVTFVDGQLLAIDDRTSVVWKLNPGSKPTPLREDDGKFDDLEGLCFDGKSNSLLLVTETKREIFEIPIGKNGTLKTPEKLGRLPKLSGSANSGCEGISIVTLPGEKKPVIAALQEKNPSALCFFGRNSLEPKGTVPIPESMGLIDVSDFCVDPKSGHLFLLSDESEVVVEVALRRAQTYVGPGPLTDQWTLLEVGRTKLPGLSGDSRLQPEGITMDDKGDLFVTSEGNQSVLRLRREVR